MSHSLMKRNFLFYTALLTLRD